jgi:transcriptional regulator with XRE-family HTH domain
MLSSDIYKQLHQARRAKGLTQSELAKILRLPQSYISQVESGKHSIKTSTLTDWARVLDLEVMLIPHAQARTVSYLLQVDSPDAQQQIPPAYGALPDEVE